MNTGEHELPMLAGIGAFIRWCEELAALLSGPILTAGLGIALVDLLTDGKLLASAPVLLFAWAASQAVGLDAQLVGSAAKLGAAIRRHAALAIVGYALLVLALGFVAFQASNVFATQEAEGITTAAALARLGMDSASWIVERSALAVVLVVLSGLLRYVAPAKVAVSLADERARLERELTLEPLRQRLRAQQVGGWRSVAQTALQGQQTAAAAQTAIDAPHASEASQRHHTAPQEGAQGAAPSGPDTSLVAPSPDRPPTGGGSPSVVSKRPRQTARRGDVLRLPTASRRDKRTAARANALTGKRGTVEQRIRAALAQDPTMTHGELVRQTRVSDSSASKYMRLIAAERAAAPSDGQVAQ